MNHVVSIPLGGTPEQVARLRALQAAFADVCNAIAPVVQSTRCWNRVALHHLVYRTMRERFPALGSQMICNAVYSVSRTARLVLQHPGSPFNIARQPPNAALPLLRFAPTAPVYFDRHTLSVKGNMLSMFTLDGRVRFALQLQPADITRFHTEKLLETVLSANNQGFRLTFQFAGPEATGAGADAKPAARVDADAANDVAVTSDAAASRSGSARRVGADAPDKTIGGPGDAEGSLPEYLDVIPPESADVGDEALSAATRMAVANTTVPSQPPSAAIRHP